MFPHLRSGNDIDFPAVFASFLSHVQATVPASLGTFIVFESSIVAPSEQVKHGCGQDSPLFHHESASECRLVECERLRRLSVHALDEYRMSTSMPPSLSATSTVPYEHGILSRPLCEHSDCCTPKCTPFRSNEDLSDAMLGMTQLELEGSKRLEIKSTCFDPIPLPSRKMVTHSPLEPIAKMTQAQSKTLTDSNK